MSNPLMNGVGVFGGTNPMALLSQLRQNPLGILRQKGFSIPNNISDPQAIIQHLMNSGQVSQQQLSQAQMMAQTLGIR